MFANQSSVRLATVASLRYWRAAGSRYDAERRGRNQAGNYQSYIHIRIPLDGEFDPRRAAGYISNLRSLPIPEKLPIYTYE